MSKNKKLFLEKKLILLVFGLLVFGLAAGDVLAYDSHASNLAFSKYSGTNNNADGVVLSACAAAQIDAPPNKKEVGPGEPINFTGNHVWWDNHSGTAAPVNYKWYKIPLRWVPFVGANTYTQNIYGSLKGKMPLATGVNCSTVPNNTLLGSSKNIVDSFGSVGEQGICLQVEDSFDFKDSAARTVIVMPDVNLRVWEDNVGGGAGTVSVEFTNPVGVTTDLGVQVNSSHNASNPWGRPFPWSTRVVLTANPNATSEVRDWNGACSVISITPPKCTILSKDFLSDRNVSIKFGPQALSSYNVTAQKVSADASILPDTWVYSSDGNIDCGYDATCPTNQDTYAYKDGRTVRLHARTKDNGVRFVQWEGACSGSDPNVCAPTVNGANVTVRARFRKVACKPDCSCVTEDLCKPGTCSEAGCDRCSDLCGGTCYGENDCSEGNIWREIRP